METLVDLGCLFATVRASRIGDTVGAHLDLDGTILSDTGLIALPEGADEIEVAFSLRRVAVLAIRKAHAEIGLAFGDAERSLAQVQVARALPLSSRRRGNPRGPLRNRGW